MGRPTEDDVRQINEAMGAAITRARKGREWTQEKLGAAVGRAQATINDWEKGKSAIALPDIRAVADALDCGTDSLFESAGLISSGDDLVDRIRRDATIEDTRKDVLVELVEASRARLAGQLDD